jgi:hypothetical protein
MPQPTANDGHIDPRGYQMNGGGMPLMPSSALAA